MFCSLDPRHNPLPPPVKIFRPPRGADIPIPDIFFWKSKDLFCLLVPWMHLYPGKAEQKCLVMMTWQEQPDHSHHSWRPLLGPISLTEDPQFEGESHKSSSLASCCLPQLRWSPKDQHPPSEISELPASSGRVEEKSKGKGDFTS